MLLRSNNVELSGRVVLVRAGRNSFAEKVRGGGVTVSPRVTSCFTMCLVSPRRWPTQPS